MKVEVTSPHGEREYAVSLSILGWVALLWRALCITFGLVWKFTKAALGGSRKGLPLYEYIVYEGMRDYQLGIDPVGIQNLLSSTAKTCAKVAKKLGTPCTEIRLRDGTIVMRLGLGRTERVIMQIHGGGYAAPALPDHIRMVCGSKDGLPDNTSVFVLQYALASEHANPYPRQLEQAVLLMEYLLHTLKVPPSSIILLGDSAGAHLALSLLLHLRHPNPRVAPLEMNGNLASAGLVNPWVVNMNLDCESVRVNEDKDILDANALKIWTENFMGTSKQDPWNSHLTAPTDWWANLPVENLLVTCGDNEVLRDGTLELFQVIQSKHPNTNIKRFPNEIHGHMYLNRFLRINKPCESEDFFSTWLDDQVKATETRPPDKS